MKRTVVAVLALGVATPWMSASAFSQTPPAQAPNPDSHYQLGPDSLPRDGVPKGEVRGSFTLPSQAYPGTEHTYWIYVPAQYDAAVPASLMIFNDGQAFKNMEGDARAPNVMDNLIYRRDLVRTTPKKPIRIFLQDGRNDNRGIGREGNYDQNRDWFFQNVWVMQALTEKGYDVNYTWGVGRHGQKQGGA